MTTSTLESLVREWLRLDQNKKTKAEIETLWKAGETSELEKRMRTRIDFGTAGLRGRMEAGWSRMNDLIIIQASQGLCQYVLKTVEDARSRGVVVGHDHRHNSEHWALLTAAAFVAKGVKAYLYSDLVHTPMVPFGVKYLNAACGVMITASHNPKDDNGYKVYWENAVQIISPHDTGIAESIRENLEPVTWNAEGLQSSSLCIDKSEELKQAYFHGLSSLNLSHDLNQNTLVKFVNTSMHGVSDPVVRSAFNQFGFPASSYIPVERQRKPDPDFPTVVFPNPEEKGALDLAIEEADYLGTNYVLAQDPDSDRFSAAEKSDGKWINFTGDQLGTIFASRIFEAHKDSGKPLNTLAIVASTVSSKMVEKMAELEGFKFVECLTGFKFIGNTALALVAEGYTVPLGYEEAIGYMFGNDIRDKDGVAATMVFAELVVALSMRNQTVKGYLEELYSRYGYFKTSNSYFICRDPPTIDRIFARIRNYEPTTVKTSTANYPASLAGLRVTSVVDLTTGYDSTNPPSYKPSLPISSGQMIQFRAENNTGLKIVLTTRTSGTEPKIKYYLEGTGPSEDRKGVDELLVSAVHELGTIWFEAEKNNLGKAA